MKNLLKAGFCSLMVSLPLSAQIRVACIGNSITAGTAVGAANAYPAFLQKLLGSGYSVHNDGVSTTTMLKNGDYPYWQHGMLSDVFSFLPNIITIKLGTNDTKPQNWDPYHDYFKRDYEAMVDTLKLISTHPKIYLVLPVPIWPNTYGIRDSALQKMISIIKQVAVDKGLQVIDANTPLRNSQNYFPDGVHPSAAGEDTIAHIIYRALISTDVTATPAASASPASVAAGKYHLTNVDLLCANIEPGRRYELSMFDAKGALCGRAIVAGPVDEKTIRKKYLSLYKGVEAIELKRKWRNLLP